MLRTSSFAAPCCRPARATTSTRTPELEEIIYVIEGEVEQWVEREKRILKPGEVAHIPRGIVHASFNSSDHDAVILAILSPAAAKGPFLVDVSGEEPWQSLRTRA